MTEPVGISLGMDHLAPCAQSVGVSFFQPLRASVPKPITVLGPNGGPLGW